MIIRIAKNNDLEALVSIYNQAIVAGFQTADMEPMTISDRKEWFESHAPKQYPIFVAEIDKQVAGYLSISPYRPGRRAVRYTAELSYYVHNSFQRRGIASNLMRQAIDICPSIGIKTLFAILIDRNSPSIKLLEKFGFEKWGFLPGVSDFDGVEAGHLYYGLRVQK